MEIVLVVVWVTTLWKHWEEGSSGTVLWAIVALLLLVILYFAEGIELAIADLRDKQAEQLEDTKSRKVLEEIQELSDFFFSQRQLFVVAIIVFTSLVTSYPWIYVPGIGKLSSYNLPFWFSLSLTTLTILWFCQVTPKRLAIINSDLFLKQSKFLWPVIKFVGALGLPEPSDHIVNLAKKFSSYGQGRHLRPSRTAHYNLATQLHGYSVDRFSVDIAISGDGSATIVKKFLTLFLHGERRDIYGYLEAGAPFVNPPQITSLALHTRSIPERLEDIIEDLDVIFEREELPPGTQFSENRLDEWSHDIENSAEISENRAEASWIIKSLRPLPESFWAPTELSQIAQPQLVALLYEVNGDVLENAFNFPNDYWEEFTAFPCRKLSVLVHGASGGELEIGVHGCEVALHNFNALLTEETENCRQRVRSGMGSETKPVEIPYPLQGGIYRIHWGSMRRR